MESRWDLCRFSQSNYLCRIWIDRLCPFFCNNLRFLNGTQTAFRMEVDGGVSVRIGFGFNNPKFSDRIIRIQPTGSTSPYEVKTIHISSLVLASQSPFFCKMFSNGMRESEQQVVIISVHAFEVQAMLDLLQFMYDNKLKANNSADLLKVPILADRFQVVSCASLCAHRLSALSMTFELATSCINLPSSLLEGGNPSSKSLIDKATCFLSKNFDSHYEEALNLPLESIEKLMSWDTLEVDCEDEVYDFLLDWARIHYEDLSERCRVFSSRLCPLVHLPYISCEKLKSMLQCKELEQCDAHKMVADALLSKFENHLGYGVSGLGLGRAYKLKPVQVTVLHDSPYRECIVYSKLTKDDCNTIAEGSVEICTQEFHVWGESFYLKFKRLPEDIPLNRGLAITLRRSRNGSTTDALTLHSEVAVRLKTTSNFAVESTFSFTLTNEGGQRFRIGEPWDSFMADDNKYFDNSVLGIRVTLRLLQ